MNILSKIVSIRREETNLQKKIRGLDEIKSSENFNRKTYSLSKKIKESKISIIAEHKRKSPSKQEINFQTPSNKIITGYDENGASGISVLTEKNFFSGSENDLIIARELTDLPILRKDFIVDEYQVFESKYLGADAILLIASCLTDKEIIKLSELAKQLDLDVLVEIHSKDELKKVCIESVDIIGVNNRNLKDFSVDIHNSIQIGKEIPESFVKISESGLYKSDELKRLIDFGYDGFLIGELFMKDNNPGKRLGKLINEVSYES
ncbi:MAG: indole-3-glycerol phosphate synthase TrpC [Flavobacteriaceae bacterium]